MSAPPPPPPPSRTTAASASSSSSASTSNDSEDSRWKRWGKSAFDKSIVVSDWASGYANSASAKLGGERFWPKSNDFPEEIAKCERILRAFTVEGIEVKPSANANSSGTSTPTGEEAQDANAEGDEKRKDNFVTKKRKVLRKIPPAVIKRAKGIVIYTAMRSGIAPFGGAGGAGLMLARLPDGSWSAPSSITPNNLALGLLLGFDIFDVILIVNTERAMESFKSHKVTLGAETAVAAGPFGTGISGEMGIDRSPVFSYVRSRGLYGGVEAMAQVFLHRFDENERIYYWPGITARDILEGKVRKPPIVDPLYRALRDAETGVAQGDSLDRTVYEPIHAPPNIAVKQLQQEESAELLQDGERLKLPPTPEELEAMEEAGIPDEFDLELERKEKEEAEKRAIEEKREIMALPPPPKHKKVRGYWEARGTKPGEKRRVAPSPLHNQAQIEGDDEKQAQKDDDQLELIDLNDDRPDVKPPLPPRRPAQSVNSLADELEQTGLEPQEEDDFEDAKEIDLPPYEGEERASALVSTMDSKSRSNRPDNTSPPLPPGVLDRSVSTSEAVPLVVSELVAHTAGDDAGPKPVLPSDLVAGESISRSNSLSKPSRPPRRAPRTGTPTTPTTPTANITTITTDAPTATSLKLFFDWDETITSSDTLSLIAPAEGEQFHGPPFSSYTDAYLSDLAAFETSFGERNDWTRQLEFLGKIDEVEVASVNRVEEGGLFRDMSKAALLQRAETRVSFREGWDAFYSWLATQTSTDGVAPTTGGGVSADIISVGWSADFIRRAILSRSASSSSSTEHKENKVIEGIYANEVETDPDTHLGTGKLTKSSPLTLLTAPQSELSPTSGIRTGLHKLHIMQSLTQPPPPNNTTERKKQVSVYVGDSTTDLPCLVNASFGLIMKKSQDWPGCSINKTIQEVSPPIRMLYENHDEFLKHSDFEDQSEKESENGVLVRVEDWSEALEVIKKIQQQQHTAPDS